MSQAIVCDNCKIRNPVDRTTCVNCGAALPVIQQAVSKPTAPKSKPSPTPTPDDPALRDYVLFQTHGILPGRPAWIAAYAILLGIAAILSLVAIGFRLLNGSLISSYNGFAPAIGVVIVSIAALIGCIELWRMHNRARPLVFLVQGIWMIVSAILLYRTFNTFPSAERYEFFFRYTEDMLKVVGSLVLFVSAPLIVLGVLFPRGFARSILRGGFNDLIGSLIILILGTALIAGSLWMSVATPIVVFDPALLPLIDRNSLLPGLLRLGLTVSIPINLLVFIGLVFEGPRFK